MTPVPLVTLTATADNNATASPTQQVSSDTINFVFKATAIDPAVDAVGTFNTFTYAANTNTPTIATSAPTQTTSSMNVNGVQVFTRALNATSTAALPTRVDVFIGKGLKSKQVDGYVSAAKSTKFSYDFAEFGTTVGMGTHIAYDEVTGVLTLNSGLSYNATTTKYAGIDIASGAYITTSGYFVFNASKSPSLVTIPSQQTVAASYWLSANFAASTTTPINFDSMEFDTHGAVTTSPTAWKFTAPSTGYYQISGFVSTNPASVFRIYKNGVVYKDLTPQITGGTYSQVANQIKLSKGDYIDFRPSVAATMTGGSLTTEGCQINIMKMGGY
jgi:hypothetical protein